MAIKTISVQKGDTLSSIAKRNNTDIKRILELNPNIKDPNLIIAGSSLNIDGNEVENVELQPTPVKKASMDPVEEVKEQPKKNNDIDFDINMALYGAAYNGSINKESVIHLSNEGGQINDTKVVAEENKKAEINVHDTTDIESDRTININPITGKQETTVNISINDNNKDLEVKADEIENKNEVSKRYVQEINNKYSDVMKLGAGNCGVMTRRQLEIQGLVKLDAGIEHGKQYARHLYEDSIVNKGHIVLGEETNSKNQVEVFESFINNSNGKLTNLVISFDPKGSFSNTQGHGHVMVISRIEDGKVYFIDDFSQKAWGTKAGTVNVLTIKEFENTYLQKKNNANFMTVVY